MERKATILISIVRFKLNTSNLCSSFRNSLGKIRFECCLNATVLLLTYSKQPETEKHQSSKLPGEDHLQVRQAQYSAGWQ